MSSAIQITPLYSGEISIFVLTETNILSGTKIRSCTSLDQHFSIFGVNHDDD